MAFSYDKNFVIRCIERMETFQLTSNMIHQNLFLTTDSLGKVFSAQLVASTVLQNFTVVVKFGKTSTKVFHESVVRFSLPRLASDYTCQILFLFHHPPNLEASHYRRHSHLSMTYLGLSSLSEQTMVGVFLDSTPTTGWLGSIIHRSDVYHT